jgi:RimJ/RimL family protein N-acetyltransferase
VGLEGEKIVDIETKRLLIRNFKIDDAGDLYDILGDEETMKYAEPAYTFENTERFLKTFCVEKAGAVAATLKETGKVIGYVLFNDLGDKVYEIGWFFNRRYWGQGYAYEACSAIISNSFETQNAHKIVAETIDAEKSVRLMKKLGMKMEGIQRSHVKDIHGNWTDFFLFGMLKGDWQQRGLD